MSLFVQNLLVLAAVGACALIMLASAYRALHGRKSGLTGCGTCSGCAPTENKPQPKTERTIMVPMDALIRSAAKKDSRHPLQTKP